MESMAEVGTSSSRARYSRMVDRSRKQGGKYEQIVDFQLPLLRTSSFVLRISSFVLVVGVNLSLNCLPGKGEICCKAKLPDPWPIFLNCPAILQSRVLYASVKLRWRRFWLSA